MGREKRARRRREEKEMEKRNFFFPYASNIVAVINDGRQRRTITNPSVKMLEKSWEREKGERNSQAKKRLGKKRGPSCS